MTAVWNGAVLPESDDTVVVGGEPYFPASNVNPDCIIESETQTVCPWKRTASYYHVRVDGQENPDAAWYYPETKPEADSIRSRVAF